MNTTHVTPATWLRRAAGAAACVLSALVAAPGSAQTCSGAPQPAIFIPPTTTPADSNFSPTFLRLFNETIPGSLRRSNRDRITMTRQSDVEEVLGVERERMLLGSDSDGASAIQEITSSLGVDWILNSSIERIVDDRFLKLSLVEARSARVERSVRVALPREDGAAFLRATEATITFGQGLDCLLRSLRGRLVRPQVRLVVEPSPPRGQPGGTLTARATLIDLASGAAVPDQPISFSYITPQGERNTPRPAPTTDADGVATFSLVLGPAHPRAGLIEAQFVGPNGRTAKSQQINYYVQAPGGKLNLASGKAQLRPTGSDTVRADLQHDARPVAAAAINLTASAGAVGSASVVTNSTGQASVSYAAPNEQRVVDVRASATVPATGERVQGTLSYVVDSGVVMSLRSGGDTTVFGASSITVELEREQQAVANATVDFNVVGGGALSATRASTDSVGQAAVFFVAPSRAGSATITARVSLDGRSYERSVTVNYADTIDAITREIADVKEALYLAPTDANLARLDRLRAVLLARGETARAEALLADNQMVGGQLSCTQDRAHRDCAAGLRDRGESTLRLLKSITAGSTESIASTVFSRASDSLVRCPHPLFMDGAVYFDRADMRDIAASYTWGMSLAMQWDNDRRFIGFSFHASDQTNPDRLFARGYIPMSANASSPYSGTIAPATGDVGGLWGNYFQINEYQRNATRPTASISVNGITVSGSVDLYDGTDLNGVQKVATLGFATTVSLPAAPEATSCHHSALPRIGPDSAPPRPITRR